MSEQTSLSNFTTLNEPEGEGREPATPEICTSPGGPGGPNWSNASNADVERAQRKREQHPVEDGEYCQWCNAGDSAFREPPGDVGEVSCGACGAVVR